MEQSSKYYTPSIEELHVGYECEHLNINEDEDEDVWEKIVWPSPYYHQSSGWTEYNDRHIEKIRTKYLDKEDIESCGWVKDWDEDSNYTDCYKLLTKSNINDQSDDKWELWQYDKIVSISSELSNRCFDGECKSINELKLIMKLLNIQ